MFHLDSNPKEELNTFTNLDWNIDYAPYEVVYDEFEGRYLKATRDIKEAELILEESPIVCGPVKNTLPICLSCYGGLDSQQNVNICSTCHFPFCSENCKKSEEHRAECSIFEQQNVQISVEKFTYQNPQKEYDLILPLRMLALKSRNPSKWKPIWKLMSQLDQLKKKSEWVEKQKYVVDYILNTLKLPNVTEDMILTLLAIDKINGITCNFNGVKIRHIHPLASILSHECSPNLKKYYTGISQGSNLQCKAAIDIKCGQKLTVSYIDLLLPTMIRQKILREEYFFECKCSRCEDSSDLNTDGNTLLCQKCSNSVKPSEWKYDKSDWKCHECLATITTSKALTVNLNAYNDALELFDNPKNWSVECYENYLKKYGKILHPNHALNIGIKYRLAGFYGKHKGYTLAEAKRSGNRNHIDRKLELLKECVQVIDRLEPGLSSFKGMMLFEFHLAIFMKTQFDIDPEMGPTQATATEIEIAYKALEKTIYALQHEQEGTFEHSILIGATIGLYKAGYPIPKHIFQKEIVQKLLGLTF